MLHYLFIYYLKDATVIDRLREILDKMVELHDPQMEIEFDDPSEDDSSEEESFEEESSEEEPSNYEYDPEIDGDGGNEEMLDQLLNIEPETSKEDE